MRHFGVFFFFMGNFQFFAVKTSTYVHMQIDFQK